MSHQENHSTVYRLVAFKFLFDLGVDEESCYLGMGGWTSVDRTLIPAAGTLETLRSLKALSL